MMVDTTVYGYVGDGYVQCPECHGERADGDDMSRLYSTDDTDEGGLSCDACGRYIFEPDSDYLAREAIMEVLYDVRYSDPVERQAEAIVDALRRRQLLAL